MWMKHLTIVVCLMAGAVHAQRTQPTREPSQATLISESTPSTTPSGDPVTGQEGCISRILNGVGIQSANVTRNYLVVTKRGRRRSFFNRHPEITSPLIQSDDSGRAPLPVTVVDNYRTAEIVRNNPRLTSRLVNKVYSRG